MLAKEPGVKGYVAEGFETVRDVFAAILAAEGVNLEVQVAAYHRGELVVDLRTGEQDHDDGVLGIYSASKGVTHLIVALLVQEGLLDLDQTVEHYWPEFAAHGKRGLLLRELLSHQAGLVGTDVGFAMDELADDRLVAERLAAQRPFWRPAAAAGYHALVMAALSGEVVYRASGQSVQSLFAERLRDPYELDLYLGLPAEQEHRFLSAQPMVATPERLREIAETTTATDSLSGIAFNRHHAHSCDVWELPNHAAVRRNGPASFGGVGTARALAKLYSAALFTTDGKQPFLARDTAAAFSQIQYAGWDLVLRQHKAWAVGFRPVAELYPSLSVGAFGHSGAGGQQALVDPRHELSYAFLRRRFAYPPQADHDHNRLIAALRAAVDAKAG